MGRFQAKDSFSLPPAFLPPFKGRLTGQGASNPLLPDTLEAKMCSVTVTSEATAPTAARDSRGWGSEMHGFGRNLSEGRRQREHSSLASITILSS